MSKLMKLLLAAILCLGLATPALAADTYGRVVAYDKAAKKVTFIEDSLGWSNPQRPEFTVLPAKEAVLAEDPGDMAPKAGGRLRIDLEKKEIIIYNGQTKTIDAFAVEIVNRQDNVEPGNPLLLADGKEKSFPMVDKAKCEVTIYSKRQKNLSTIKVPQKYMDLPDSVWDDGHNIKLTLAGDKGTNFVNLSKAK